MGEKIYVERTFRKTYEYLENKKYVFEYDNKWIDDCNYDLIFKRTTKPNYKDAKIGEKFKVEILEIDDKKMKYVVTFRGNDTRGEMMKDN